MAQAEAVAEALSKEKIAAVYSSDLRRATATAERIAKRHLLPVNKRFELREVNYGEWEGLTEEECRHRNPLLFEQRSCDPENVPPPGGESYRQMMERFLPTVAEIASRHGGESVVIVTHHGNIRVLLCDVMQIPRNRYRSFEICNGSLTELINDNQKFVVRRINDISHLSQGSERDCL